MSYFIDVTKVLIRVARRRYCWIIGVGLNLLDAEHNGIIYALNWQLLNYVYYIY